MATKNVTIAVENEVLQALAASVDAEKPNEVTTACEKIAQAALLEWYEWMTGSRRYLSLTEQQIERVAYLYRELLPKERPSATDISYRFKIPDGPASYLSRVLGDRKIHSLAPTGIGRT